MEIRRKIIEENPHVNNYLMNRVMFSTVLDRAQYYTKKPAAILATPGEHVSYDMSCIHALVLDS